LLLTILQTQLQAVLRHTPKQHCYVTRPQT
jgi:hypothetical protein